MAGEELLGAGEVAEDVVHAGCGGYCCGAERGFDPGLEFFLVCRTSERCYCW